MNRYRNRCLTRALLAGAWMIPALAWPQAAASSNSDVLLMANPSTPDDHWNATSLEATTMLGEVMYHFDDVKDAKEKFRDSLSMSTKLRNPGQGLMALDLYRAAELEFQDGDDDGARHHLEILMSRYPDSPWAAKGKCILAQLPKDRKEDSYGETLTAAQDQGTPAALLKQLQASLRGRQWEQTRRECRSFRERYPENSLIPEIALLEGLLELHLNEPAQAAKLLESLAAESVNADLRAKAQYLLGAAYNLLGDDDALRRAVPEIRTAKGQNSWLVLSQIWRANADLRIQKWDRAIAGFRVVIQSPQPSPMQAYALAALATEADRNGRTRDAKAYLAAARQLADQYRLDDVESYAQISAGHLLYRQKDYSAAAKAYGRFLKDHPNHLAAALAAYQRGLALKWGGRPHQAIAAFSELVQRFPKSEYASPGYLQLGQIYADQGMSQEAITAYDKMHEAASAGAKGQDKEATLLIAQVHYNRKEFREAIPYYQSFLGQAPNDPKASEVQGLLLNAYWQGARNDPSLERAIDNFPNQPVVAQIRWDLAVRAYKAGNFQSAENHFKRLAEDFPSNSNAAPGLFYQAESLMQLQNYQDAAQAYRRLLEVHPNTSLTARSRFRLGVALFEAGDYRGAAQAYNAYRPRDKNDPPASDATFNRALALQRAGLKPDSIAAYEKLVGRFPKYPKASWAWLQIALMREEAGQLERAAAAYKRVRSPDRAQALWNMGRDYEKLKERIVAQKTYEELRRLKPASDPYRLRGILRLALLYELTSPMKAQPLYKEVLRLSRDNSLTDVAAKRLQGMQMQASRALPSH